MTGADVAAIYESKAIEYLIAVTYLVLFVFFWRYLDAGPAPARAEERTGAGAEGWFSLAPAVALHPGHAWAAQAGSTVFVGLDDFANKLIGPKKGIRLPAPGTILKQGETAWTVLADGKGIDMVSPVDGVVEQVNPEAEARPDELSGDPYGRGWLLRVRATDWARSAEQLLSGREARKLMDDAAYLLRSRLSPELGAVLQDGGRPVHGIARELAPENWDVLARQLLGTARKE
jgi:glycine cleavage system H lipoate-binding protein